MTHTQRERERENVRSEVLARTGERELIVAAEPVAVGNALVARERGVSVHLPVHGGSKDTCACVDPRSVSTMASPGDGRRRTDDRHYEKDRGHARRPGAEPLLVVLEPASDLEPIT
jgi:hypothetical protein